MTMTRTLQKIVTLQKPKEQPGNQLLEEESKLSGFLSHDDIKKLRNLKAKKSVYRKTQFKNWDCSNCGHVFYYKISRCPLCESADVQEITRPTQYEYSEEVVISEHS